MVENELKMMLSQEQFKKVKNILSAKYGIVSPKTQINYYYDSHDFAIANSGKTLRVRQKSSNLSIEYKCQKSILNNIRECDEFKKIINKLPYTIILSEIFSIKDDYNYSYIGNLITERTDYKIGYATVSLDKNYYLGEIDYELEIESVNLQEIIDIKALIDLEFPVNEVGKYKRYYYRLLEWSNI